MTAAEMKSLAIQRGWGEKKLIQLDSLISQFLIVPINTERQMKVYSEIDAYSKHKDKIRNYPAGYSSVTVGKNDLWIAATANVTNSKLVSADGDFDHLDGVFIDLVKFKI